MLAHRRSYVASAAACALAGLASLVEAADLTYSFNIPEERLADTLIAIGHQTTTNIVFAPETVDDAQSPAIRGTFTLEQAVTRALAKTKLQARQATANSILIEELATASNPSKQRFIRVSDQQPAVADPPGDFRMAQADQGVPAPNPPLKKQGEETRKAKSAELEEVVVTGTHIRHEESAGSNVIVLDRDYIDKSGYASVPDILKTIPQNFGGGVGENQSLVTRDTTAGNYNYGTAINLRGLGADSTLVLVDGRRQPVSGFNGAFTDISGIAASAIDRIEILPDGASAIYGSDAVAGVVNIILRKDFEGGETNARVGTYAGDATETQFSQMLGTRWTGGSVLVGYEFLKRSSIADADHVYLASDDLRPFGGSDFRNPYCNPGNILDPNTFSPAYAIPPGQNGTGLTPNKLLAGQTNLCSLSGGGAQYLPTQKLNGAFMKVNQAIGDSLEIFGEGRFSRREITHLAAGFQDFLSVPSSNPFFVDPFGGQSQIYLLYNYQRDLGGIYGEGTVDTGFGTVGATLKLPKDWQLTLTGSYGSEDSSSVITNLPNEAAVSTALADPNPATAFNPFGDGSYTNPTTLATMRGMQRNASTSYARDVNLTADGRVFDLPGGTVRAALGGDYREEDVDSALSSSNSPTTFQSLGRHVSAAFAEVSLPIVGEGNAFAGVKHFDISVAGRYENYSDFGSTTNPRLGLRWVPTDSLTIRGTWGTAFKAPRLIQLLTNVNTQNYMQTTLDSPTGMVNALVLNGNNPDLKEERAHVWTAGLDLVPVALSGLRASLTYFDYNYKNRIELPGPPGNQSGILFQESQWASVITRNPSSAQVAAVCSSPYFQGESISACLTSAPQVIVDFRWVNLASVEVRGADLNLSYRWETSRGSLLVNLDETYTGVFNEAVTSTSPEVDVVNTLGNVPHLRLRGGPSWTYGPFNLYGIVNFTNRYDDNISIPNRSISSWTTLDTGLSYHFASDHRWSDNLKASLTAVNVFNHNPPFANVENYGFDPANANLYGRILSGQLTKTW